MNSQKNYKEERLSRGTENQKVFLSDNSKQKDSEETQLCDSEELVYRAIMNTVNRIWDKYADYESNYPGLLGTEQIKGFLKEFLKD